MNVFKYIWPWSELDRLRRQCHAHWEFGEVCLFCLDVVHSTSKHVRFNDQLYVVGPTSTQVIKPRVVPDTPIYIDDGGNFTEECRKKFVAANYGFPGSADTTIITTVDHDYHAHSNEADKSLWRSLTRRRP